VHFAKSFSFAIGGTAMLWSMSAVAYSFALPASIIVVAFVLGCFLACFEAVRLLD
jgi:hypothetical protein